MAEYLSQFSLLSLSATLLFITSNISVVIGQTTGVFLSLNGRTIPNDGYVLVNNIGIHDSGLHCHTGRNDCCKGSDNPNGGAQGHWYRPDESEVMSFTIENAGESITSNRHFFSRDRVTRIVRLNRYGSPPMKDRGRFRCVIPNADGDTVTLFVNIVDMIPTTMASPPPTEPPMTITSQSTPATSTEPAEASTTTPPTTTSADTPGTTAPPQAPVSISVAPITLVGTNTAGESYRLECSVTVAGSTDQPTITWLDPMNNQITSGVETTGSMSTLTFNPLAASDGGTYTCRATLGGAMDSASWTITVQDSTITVSIVSSVATPMVGSLYSLTCAVTGAERLSDAMVTYQWFKNGVAVPDQTTATLSFSLTFSDAGRYICQATVSSSLLSGPITRNNANTIDIILTFPRPTVMISSNATSDVFIGSTVMLTCTVELSSTVDVPVTVNVQLSDPSGNPLTTTTTQSVSGSTYTFTATIQIVSLAQSGAYTCTASLNSSSSLLAYSQPQTGTTTIMAAIPPPLNIRATQSSSSGPVEVSWSPPSDGANIITGYRIFYENERSVLLPSIATGLDLKLDGNQIGQQVSIRSEKEQEFSELSPITITESTSESATVCNNNTSVALGVVILLVVFIATSVIVILICAFLRRRPSGMKEQSKLATDDLSVSANAAYGQVKMVEPSPVAVPQGVYEELGTLAPGGGATEYATCAAGGTMDVTHTP